MVYYRITPSSSGTFTAESSGSYDTYAHLYSSSESQITYNDDGGSGSNFKLTYNVTGGTTYYLGVRMYSSSRTGSFTVNFTLPTPSNYYTITYNANGGWSAPASQRTDSSRSEERRVGKECRSGWSPYH